MKLISSALLIVLLCCTTLETFPGGNSQKKKSGQGYPAFYKTGVQIDGKSSEWESGLFYYDSDAKTVYAIVNDSASLFVCLKVLGEEQQMMIMHNGLEIWIDPAGKKNKVAGIICPLNSPRLVNGRSMQKPGEKPDQQKMFLQSILLVKEMTLIGFKDEINGTRHMDYNATGIKVVLGLDSTGALVYEAKIPFSAFRTEIKSAKVISLGCIIPGLESPRMDRGEKPPGNMNDGGMQGDSRHGGGGMPGGNMQGGGMPEGGGGHGGGMGPGGGPGQGDMQNMNKETSFWHKSTLAQPEKLR